mmetsp:Transcript_121689/g.349764  ORF Transcript_121689/g.349764 Transcript_121689/m.349764 type:complete len:222 (+) Transcript_121689:414-1079(+)
MAKSQELSDDMKRGARWERAPAPPEGVGAFGRELASVVTTFAVVFVVVGDACLAVVVVVVVVVFVVVVVVVVVVIVASGVVVVVVGTGAAAVASVGLVAGIGAAAVVAATGSVVSIAASFGLLTSAAVTAVVSAVSAKSSSANTMRSGVKICTGPRLPRLPSLSNRGSGSACSYKIHTCFSKACKELSADQPLSTKTLSGKVAPPSRLRQTERRLRPVALK